VIYKKEAMYSLQMPQTETTIRARIRGGSVGQLPGASTYEGRYNVTGIRGNIVLVNPGFNTRMNLS
jgi:hypothetical protein